MTTESNYMWDVLGLGTIVVDHLITLSGALEPDVILRTACAEMRECGKP